MGTLSEKATLLLLFVSLFNKGHLFKERICPSPHPAMFQFFSLKVNPLLERLLYPGKQTGSRKNCSLFKMAYKLGMYPYNLIVSLSLSAGGMAVGEDLDLTVPIWAVASSSVMFAGSTKPIFKGVRSRSIKSCFNLSV